MNTLMEEVLKMLEEKFPGLKLKTEGETILHVTVRENGYFSLLIQPDITQKNYFFTEYYDNSGKLLGAKL